MAIKPISQFPKFTDIPEWAMVVAQHADGEWWFYESLPKIVANVGFKSYDRSENQMPANIKTNPNNWETTATYISRLKESVIKEAASQEAYLLHRMTDVGQDAAQNFIDANPSVDV